MVKLGALKNKDIVELSERFLATTYSRSPVAIVRGNGCRVWDADGREYLDFVSGLAVNNLGHCHPRVVETIKEQASRLLHVSNLYHIETQARLAETLCKNSFANRVFFCNSGAEANEAAIKLTRKYFDDRGEGERYSIITAINSFHGRTMATLSATGQDKFHKGFDPLMDGFTYVEFNDIGRLRSAIDDKTAAIMLEPIQGEGGVHISDDNYFRDVRSICDEHDILLILDEVQTGMGRTGRLFAHEHYGITPDIMTLAKGLGGGLPIGAMLAREDIASSFTPGTHASTFGGNPLVTSAGLAVMDVLLEDGFLKDVEENGLYLMDRLDALKQRFDFIKDVRGKGLMIGMELSIPGSDIVRSALDRGLLINCTCEKILRFLPPLVITKHEIDSMLKILEDVLKEV